MNYPRPSYLQQQTLQSQHQSFQQPTKPSQMLQKPTQPTPAQPQQKPQSVVNREEEIRLLLEANPKFRVGV